MALRFVLGGSGSGKSEYVQDLAVRLSLEDRRNSIYMIVPDQFTMQTQWQMANRHPDGGIINIDVLSFSRLPRKVFEEVGQPQRLLLDDTGKCLLVRRSSLKVREKLNVLSRGMDNPGWPAEVKSVISEFMQYGIEVSDVDELSKKAGDRIALKKKLEDLKILYDAFLKECADRYVTREEMLDVLCERIPLSKEIPKSTLIFDGFTGFTPVQMKVITVLAKYAKDVIITFLYENNTNLSDNDDYLFELTRKNVNSLKKRMSDSGVEIGEEIKMDGNYRHADNEALMHLERNLFRKKGFAPVSQNDSVKIVKCGDIDSECHALCAELFRLVKEKNYRYRDVAIVCGDMASYQRSLAKYLTGYKVPFYMDSNRNINANPLVKYIVSAIGTVKNRFAVDDVMKFMRSGLAPFSEDETDKFENYIHARGIRGIKKYKEPFTHYTYEIENDEKHRDEIMDELNATREKFIAVFEPFLIDGSFKKRKLNEWLRDLYGMLENTKAAEKLDSMADELKDAGENVLAKEYETVYNKVMDLFDQLGDLMGGENYSSSELLDILNVGFNEIRIGVLPQNVDSLLVGDMERTRLGEIKALFFIGVNDKNIPKNKISGGLLSLPEREFLREDDITLAPTPSEQAFIEQLYLYLNVTKPTDYLYMSFASVGNRGESLLPSYFIEVVKKMYSDLEVEKGVFKTGLMSIDDIKEETGRLLRLYAAQTASEEEEKTLFGYIGLLRLEKENAKWCEKIIETAFKEYKPIEINDRLMKELYGEILNVSISRLEKFAACRYSYFVTYGLKLTEREEYGLELSDMGTLSHAVLEQVGKKLKEENLDFSSATTEVLESFVDEIVDKESKNYDGGLLEDDNRKIFYTKQLKRIMKRTVRTLGHQLSLGKFKPYDFEEHFENLYMKGEGTDETVRMSGVIDRIDIYSDALLNQIYVKILDYKSSQKDFKPENLQSGISLQLAIYMKNAIKKLKEIYPDKEVLPAAMLYYKIDDPFVAVERDAQTAINMALRPTGAVADNDVSLKALDEDVFMAGRASEAIPVKTKAKPDDKRFTGSSVYPVEEFNGFIADAEAKALEEANRIIHGKADINPLLDANPCLYCAAKGICGFDSKIPGYEFRTKDTAISKDVNAEDEQ